MAITSELTKVTVQIVLDNGTDAQGRDTFVKVSLGNLDESNYDSQKAINIAKALAPILSKEVSSYQESKTSILEEGE